MCLVTVGAFHERAVIVNRRLRSLLTSSYAFHYLFALLASLDETACRVAGGRVSHVVNLVSVFNDYIYANMLRRDRREDTREIESVGIQRAPFRAAGPP